MLVARADWTPLGNADEGKPVADGSVHVAVLEAARAL